MKACELIGEARRRAGLTQTALARAAGITPGLLSRYENGHVEPTSGQLDRLLAPLGLEVVAAPRSETNQRDDLADGLDRLIDVYPDLPPPGDDDSGVHDGATGRRLSRDEYEARVAENKARYRRWLVDRLGDSSRERT